MKGSTMMTPKYTKAKEDAEVILEHVICRNNWDVAVRDELALALETIVRREYKAMLYHHTERWGI